MADDAYDLGDTELYPRQEAEPYKKPDPQVEVAPASPAPSIPPGSPAATPEAPPAPIWIESANQWHYKGRFVGKELPEELKSLVPVQSGPSKPTHPQWLLKQAQELAFDDDDMSLPTDQLYKQVNRVMKERAQWRDTQSLLRTIEQGQGLGRGPLSEAPKAPPALAPEESLGISKQEEEEIHPSIITLFKNQARQIAELRQFIAQIRNVQVQREHESYSQAVHRIISEHAEPGIVGDKSFAEFDWESPENSPRQAIHNEAVRLAGGPKATPAEALKRIPEAVQRLRYGKRSEKGEKKTQPAAPPRNGKSYTPEEWAAAGLPVPTHRSGAPEPNQDEVAYSKLEKRMRDAGVIPGPAEDQATLDTLLG